MHRTVVFAVAMLALAGCNQHKAAEPAQDGASAAAPAAAGGGLPHPQPGLYRSTVKLVSMEAPGLPPAMGEQMKAAMARKSEGQTYCLKPEEAERGYESRVQQLAGRPGCAFDHFTTTAGKLDAGLTCASPQGVKAVIGMQGTMTPTVSDVTMRISQSGPQVPGGGMTMTMQVRSERIGDCS